MTERIVGGATVCGVGVGQSRAWREGRVRSFTSPGSKPLPLSSSLASRYKEKKGLYLLRKF